MAKGGGQPGNNNAGKNKRWINAIERAIAQSDPDRLRALAEKLIMKAEDGDLQAMKELGDRLDGKPAQAITGADGETAIFKIITHFPEE